MSSSSIILYRKGCWKLPNPLNFINPFFFSLSLDNFRGQTALHKAAENKQRNICYMLVAGGASLTMKDSDGQTPMMLAFQADDHDLAAYLESKTQKPKTYLELVATV